MTSSGIGFVLAASSAVLNGSFVAFSKLPSVKAAGVDPLVFQLWTCFGVFLSSLLTIPFIEGDKYPLQVLGWGILSGGLFVCAVAFSFVAVQLVGLSIGQGIWSGSAVVVSFLWGACAFGDQVNAGVAAAGLILIVLGVCGIAFCAEITARFCAPPPAISAEELNSTLLENSSGFLTPTHHRTRTGGSVDLNPRLVHPAMQRALSASMPSSPSLSTADGTSVTDNSAPEPSFLPNDHTSLVVDTDPNWARRGSSFHEESESPCSSYDGMTPEETATLHRQRLLYGSACALIVGLFGGSCLVPLKLAPSQFQGISFVPSFGLGTLLIAPLITLPYMWLSRSSSSRGNWAVRESLLPGLLAGAVWNGANVCSIYAIPAVGFSVAQPTMQCAIAIAALWGVLVFKEIRGRQIGVMALGAVIVLGGAVVLALSKQ